MNKINKTIKDQLRGLVQFDALVVSTKKCRRKKKHRWLVEQRSALLKRHWSARPSGCTLETTRQLLSLHLSSCGFMSPWGQQTTRILYSCNRILYYIHYSVFSSCIPCITSTFPVFLAHNPRFKAAAQLRFFVWPKFKISKLGMRLGPWLAFTKSLRISRPSQSQLWKTNEPLTCNKSLASVP